MRHKLDEEAVFAALADAVGQVCDLDPASLKPDGAVGALNIDSMDAAEIVLRTETNLGVQIEPRKIPRDWDDLTLGTLARKLARLATPRPANEVGPVS